MLKRNFLKITILIVLFIPLTGCYAICATLNSQKCPVGFGYVLPDKTATKSLVSSKEIQKTIEVAP